MKIHKLENSGQQQIEQNKGPTLFEIEYIRQLESELNTFLHGHQFPTVKGIVLGIQGVNYQTIIPIASGE